MSETDDLKKRIQDLEDINAILLEETQLIKEGCPIPENHLSPIMHDFRDKITNLQAKVENLRGKCLGLKKYIERLETERGQNRTTLDAVLISRRQLITKLDSGIEIDGVKLTAKEAESVFSCFKFNEHGMTILKRALNGKCYYCGEKVPLIKEHMTPRSKAGMDSVTNVIPACGKCNSKKGTKSAEEFMFLNNIVGKPCNIRVVDIINILKDGTKFPDDLGL